jgi:flagella basal body P-ring formation protein FlgA
MRKFIGTVIGLLVFVAAVTRADGSVSNATAEPLSRIRQAATAYVAAHAAATARIDVATLDSRLRLPACPRPLTARGGQAANGGAWSVAISCEPDNGNPALWSLYVPVRVIDSRPVVVLARGFSAGLPVPSDAVTTEVRDVGQLGYGYVGDPQQVIGHTLRRPVMAGTIVTPDLLAAPVQVKRGAIVTLLVVADGMEIRAQGKALSDGGTGDHVSIENTGSHRIVDGVVLDGSTVEVGFR